MFVQQDPGSATGQGGNPVAGSCVCFRAETAVTVQVLPRTYPDSVKGSWAAIVDLSFVQT
jgi:hypothetical protein